MLSAPILCGDPWASWVWDCPVPSATEQEDTLFSGIRVQPCAISPAGVPVLRQAAGWLPSALGRAPLLCVGFAPCPLGLLFLAPSWSGSCVLGVFVSSLPGSLFLGDDLHLNLVPEKSCAWTLSHRP